MNFGNFFQNNGKNEQTNKKEINNIKSSLTCSIMNLNYFDNKDNIFGYPILQYNKSIKNKIELYPIPELVSYKGFISQIGKFENKLGVYYDNNNNNYNIFYNYWMPIYIDESHFEKNRNTILYTFTIIKSGISDIKNEYNFESLHYFEIFEIIINKLIEGIINNIAKSSFYSFIRCLFHYILLFKKLSEEFDKDYSKYLNHKFNIIHKNQYKINESIIPDIQNMISLLYFCNRNIYTEKMIKIWHCLFEEFLLRNIGNNFDGNEMKEILHKIIKEIVKENVPEIKKNLFLIQFLTKKMKIIIFWII